jgi:hypothetical protein
MFIESEAMIGAMAELMRDGVPSLSVHDSLIVPETRRDLSADVLSRHYQKQIGVDPVLKINGPLPTEPTLSGVEEFADTDPVEETRSDDEDNYRPLEDSRSGVADGEDEDVTEVIHEEDDYNAEDRDDDNNEYDHPLYF